MSTMTSAIGGQVLYGDWRRRRGTKTDAHLYQGSGHHPYDQRPACGKAIRHMSTERVAKGLPCRDCLVAALTS